MELALYQPDIAQNVGTILRLCACMNVAVHIIEPCGFVWDDKKLRRAGMDYLDHVCLTRHDDWKKFLGYCQRRQKKPRLVLLSTKASQALWDAEFTPDDILVFGRESAGVPENVANACDLKLRIPMHGDMRSLNVAMSTGIALSHALYKVRKD